MTEQIYSTTTTIESYRIKETRFSNTFKDTVDACYDKNHDKFIGFEGNKRNGQETKSVVQQRIERLYGRGALAQGFFVIKRQKNRLSESDAGLKDHEARSPDQHSKSMSDKMLVASHDDTSPMKQSTSSPVLPVLRHLRPEFRAQLPIVVPRKNSETVMSKSSTVPVLKDEQQLNGHSNGTDVKINCGDSIQIELPPEEVKDGHYFLKILENEANRLLTLADECEAHLEMSSDLPEDAIGKIRSVSGKARLLVSQKMQQFKGLCTNNITQIEGEAFPTTNEDLQGFWDMVMLQVNQVDALFDDIQTLKRNGWNEVEPVKKNRVINGGKAKKVTNRSTNNSTNDELRKQRELERKRLIEERRKAMKAKSNQHNSVEIFVSETS